ncbi:unnamed protein product [Miscanthus lutarioriparius]|uniref:Uncharacterized protein n=1 Tax=Miscanthus lutarioriparius TaxID=422564 RepID=A0A811NUS3_9POAL|nr:unnamed protein product [Miscanthus lutarioriparius]
MSAAADSSSSSIGVSGDAAVSSLSPESIGHNDLLIVGLGVLGRILAAIVVASNWNGEGSSLFTSSTAAYDCSDNGFCSEDSPCVPIGQSPRTDVLLKAENVVLEAGGCVLRLDAASLAIAIMKKRLRSRIFVGCDNEPLSRLEIMDRVNRSGKFDTQFQGFTGTDGPLGKRMENSKTRAELGWQPKYPSFTEFLGLSNL